MIKKELNFGLNNKEKRKFKQIKKDLDNGKITLNQAKEIWRKYLGFK